MSNTEKLPLKNLMGARGLSVQEFAEAVGVSLPTVTNWRKGHTRPNAKFIPRIESVLGVSYSDIDWAGTS